MLTVNRDILTADSDVFRRLINDLCQTEIEMKDFAPDNVRLFMKQLENKAVDVIKKSHFRELHKLYMVFGVCWLAEHSRSWLKYVTVRAFTDEPEYESQVFVFEESLYIFKKWNNIDLISHLITLVRFRDSSEHFIKEFMRNITPLETAQLQFLLLLAGSNAKVILESIIKHLKNRSLKSLDANTWFLVQNLNMAHCFKTCPDLTYRMFEMFADLDDAEDVRKLFKLMSVSSRAAFNGSCRSRRSQEKSTAIFDGLVWNELYSQCNTLEDIVTNCVKKRDIINLYTVVDLLGKVTYFHPPSPEESSKFVETIIDCCRDLSIRRVSRQYIDQVILALRFSDKDTKCQSIHLLEVIRDNPVLASHFHNIRQEGVELNERDLGTGAIDQYNSDQPAEELSSFFKKVLNTLRKNPGQPPQYSTEDKQSSNELYFKINFDYPDIMNCNPNDEGKCRGIILKHSMKGLDYTLELCEDAEVYQANGVYLDTQLEVEDIHWFMEMSVETEGGVRVTVPVSRSGWWWRMWLLQSGQGWRLEKMCVVELDVSRYLVAK